MAVFDRELKRSSMANELLLIVGSLRTSKHSTIHDTRNTKHGSSNS